MGLLLQSRVRLKNPICWDGTRIGTGRYTTETLHVPPKGTISIGNISSNHQFSIDMLVFRGVGVWNWWRIWHVRREIHIPKSKTSSCQSVMPCLIFQIDSLGISVRLLRFEAFFINGSQSFSLPNCKSWHWSWAFSIDFMHGHIVYLRVWWKMEIASRSTFAKLCKLQGFSIFTEKQMEEWKLRHPSWTFLW